MTADQQTIEPLLVDAKTASRLCGVSRSAWYSLLSQGRIGPPVIRIGSRCLYSISDLENWVAMRNPETGQLPNREQWIERQKGQQR
jgi:predicted DNA-binding transcriptional regulator AlpA